MNRSILRLLFIFLLIISCYALGRFFFRLTDGFTLSNISSTFSFQPQWETRPLEEKEQQLLAVCLDQPYYYLSKGCQSYVFISQDQKYVIKFFKHQRHRIPPWLRYFPPLPSIVQYRQEKEVKKWHKLNYFFTSWKLAFDHLKTEAGLIFVHLNKTNFLDKKLTIYDKLQREHIINLDQTAFCVQYKANLLCDLLLSYQKENKFSAATKLIDRLLHLIITEYTQGFIDNDHALMQNTGVIDEYPMHIDIGQFERTEALKDPKVLHQELFTKMYRFMVWLKKHYPELASYTEQELLQILGPAYFTMQPKFRDKNI